MDIIIQDFTIEEIKNIAITKTDTFSVDTYTYYQIEFSIDYKENKDNLHKFHSFIQSKGYYLEIKNSLAGRQDVVLRVPFEDLIRRFYNLLTALALELDCIILNFNSKQLN